MVLSEREKHGLAELLQSVCLADLVSLAQTCTSRLILPETSSEAISAIILHTDSAEELLRRKKVKKDVLFKYLHAKRVDGVLPSQEKAGLMEHVLRLWDSPCSSRPASSSSSSSSAAPPSAASALSSARTNAIFHPELALSLSLSGVGGGGGPGAGQGLLHHQDDSCSLPDAPAPSRNTSYSSLCSLDLGAPAGVSSSVPNGHGHLPPSLGLILSRSRSTSGGALGLDAASETGSTGGLVMGMNSDSTWSMATDDALAEAPVSASSHSLSACNSAFRQPASHPRLHNSNSSHTLVANSSSMSLGGMDDSSNSSTCATSGSSSQQQAQALADTFVRWFYDLINSINSQQQRSSSSNSETDQAFTSDHFWADASAKIGLVNNPGQGQAETLPELIQVEKNGKEVCSVITDVVRKYNLIFNPNLCGEGVSGKIDPHGLVLVSACGTLHTAPPPNSPSPEAAAAQSQCCGTFLQIFGLIRDPFEGNNWKIKFTQAKMVSQAVVEELPRLRGAESYDTLFLDWAGHHQHQSSGSSSGGNTTAMALS